jgi:hypothetical protein
MDIFAIFAVFAYFRNVILIVQWYEIGNHHGDEMRCSMMRHDSSVAISLSIHFHSFHLLRSVEFDLS